MEKEGSHWSFLLFSREDNNLKNNVIIENTTLWSIIFKVYKQLKSSVPPTAHLSSHSALPHSTQETRNRQTEGSVLNNNNVSPSREEGDGGRRKKRARPIIVRFTSYRDRQRVFNVKKQLKNTGVTICEDLTRR
ncbi:hypothetical protein J6590_088938 [Homalodisca vitripennis]|nr:hypothetical protein J6590_088938 [Homalodisca vitripennis]